MLITSASNEKLKNIKKLSKSAKERREQGLYIVEGIRSFREIPADDIHAIYVAESVVDNGKFSDAIETASGVPVEAYADSEMVHVLPDKIFNSLADTDTPQGILAVVKQRKYSLNDVLGEDGENTACNTFVLIIERLQDPGNLGTIIRTAEGAGVTGIIISSDSVDIYNPKVVRATMGAIFRVPIYVSEDLIHDIEELKSQAVTVYGAHLDGTNLYDKDFVGKCAFLIGNEGNGLSDEVSSMADELIRIPMKGSVESLNAAISTAVIAYEVLRQRL